MKKLALALLLAGTTASAQTVYPVTITHFAGKTTLAKRPVRIVALQEEMGELTQALNVKLVGFGGRIVKPLNGPINEHGYLDMEKLGNPISVGLGREPSLEILTALKPDLIIAGSAPALVKLYPALSKIAPTIIWNFNSNPQDGWHTPLRETARALGDIRNGDKSIAEVDKALEAARKKLLPISSKTPRVTPLYIYGQNAIAIYSNSAFPKTLARMGFKPTEPRGLKTPDVPSGGIEISSEALVNLDTDWVLITRAQVDGKWSDDTIFDTVLKKQNMKVVDMHLPGDISGDGPIIDVYYAKELQKALGIK